MRKYKMFRFILLLTLLLLVFTGCISKTEHNETLQKIKALENQNKELKEKVVALQSAMDENNFSYIKLDKDNKVSGWFNKGGLSKVLDKPEENAPIIRIGSSKEDVIKALGAPIKIDPNFSSTWYYMSVNVKFGENEKVSEIK